MLRRVYECVSQDSCKFNTKPSEKGEVFQNLLARIVDLGSAVACRTGIIIFAILKTREGKGEASEGARHAAPYPVARVSRPRSLRHACLLSLENVKK